MDWLRRNWPDLLIGLALIAVIAGIVATLLTGGSFFPLGGGSGPTVSAPATPSTPADPSTPPDPSSPGDAGATVGAVEDGPSVAVLPPSDGNASDLPPGAPAPDASADGPASSPSETPAVTPVEPDAPAAAAPDAPAAPGASPEAAAAAEPEPAGAVASAPATDAGLPTEPYRVSVGAFGSRDNAQTQAARFREAGYPVFLGTQDALTLVLVGPYDDAGRAEAVAAEIREGPYDVDPVIYEFRPDAGAAGAAPAPQAASAPTPEPADPTPSAAAPAQPSAPGGDDTVLQVGAYVDQDSAAPQIERLSDLGFEADSIREDGFVKLVIGPLSGTALEDARTILDGAGVEYFAR